MRWKAVITYRIDTGLMDVEHSFEEIEELHDIVEHDPDWNCIVSIVITLRRVKSPGQTLERAASS